MARWIVYGTVFTEVEAETIEEAYDIGEAAFYAETHPDYSIEAELIEEEE